jgi:hypothetical protein
MCELQTPPLQRATLLTAAESVTWSWSDGSADGWALAEVTNFCDLQSFDTQDSAIQSFSFSPSVIPSQCAHLSEVA